jgi:hypothetical protein
MLYEKLAEAKDEKKRKGLSAGQMLGVGATGLLGGYGGMRASIEPLEDRARNQMKASKEEFLATSHRVWDEGLNRPENWTDGRKAERAKIETRYKNHLEKLKQRIDPTSGAYIKRRHKLWGREIKEIHRHERATDPIHLALKKRVAENERINRKLSLGVAGAGLVGAGLTSYGAKKLFDVYNQRKQQRS